MSKSVSKHADSRRVNSDLFTLTYGSLIAQLLKDYENADDVNKQLNRMGHSIGERLIEDFLAKTSGNRCLDFKDVADKLQAAFRMYLGINPTVGNWSAGSDEFSLFIDNNPLIDFVELPDNLVNLKYCNIFCGVIKGALEMVQIEVQAYFVQDQLKGDPTTEIRVKFIKKIADALPY